MKMNSKRSHVLIENSNFHFTSLLPHKPSSPHTPCGMYLIPLFPSISSPFFTKGLNSGSIDRSVYYHYVVTFLYAWFSSQVNQVWLTLPGVQLHSYPSVPSLTQTTLFRPNNPYVCVRRRPQPSPLLHRLLLPSLFFPPTLRSCG